MNLERIEFTLPLIKTSMETNEQDTHPVTVYRDWNGYGYHQGHIDMECKHSHVNWTEKDLETIRTAEKVRQSVSSLLSIYLL